MKYHKRTFALLGLNAVLNPKAEASISKAERRLGYRLPASLREWYSLEGAERILNRFARCDAPIPLRKFGVQCAEEDESEELLAWDKGYLIIRFEEQGVCKWGVELNGSNDPPVAVSYRVTPYDSDEQGWTRATDTFSHYVYNCVWDGQALSRKWLAEAENGPLSNIALETLREEFVTGPVSYGVPGDVQYRFERGSQRILLWVEDEGCDWSASADDRRSFLDLLKSIGQLDDVMSRFYSATPAADALIKRVTAE